MRWLRIVSIVRKNLTPFRFVTAEYVLIATALTENKTLSQFKTLRNSVHDPSHFVGYGTKLALV
jgi:hypothetical protein